MTIDFVWNKEENSPFPEEAEKQRFQTTKDFFFSEMLLSIY